MAELYLSETALNSIYYNPQLKRIITNQKCLYIDLDKEALNKKRSSFSMMRMKALAFSKNYTNMVQ